MGVLAVETMTASLMSFFLHCIRRSGRTAPAGAFITNLARARDQNQQSIFLYRSPALTDWTSRQDCEFPSSTPQRSENIHGGKNSSDRRRERLLGRQRHGDDERRQPSLGREVELRGLAHRDSRAGFLIIRISIGLGPESFRKKKDARPYLNRHQNVKVGLRCSIGAEIRKVPRR